MVSSVLLSTFLLAEFAVLAKGDAFLQAPNRRALQRVTRGYVEQSLLSELSGLANPAQLRSIEEELRPMYASLPKSEQGTLDRVAVRYALHRFFTKRHGWYVQGLDPSGEAWNMSSATSVMEELAPSYIQELFEERLHGHGLGLHELAIFAAMLLDLIHMESVANLERIYTSLELPTVGPLSWEQSDAATKAYLLEYAMGITLNGTGMQQYDEVEAEVVDIYPAWSSTMMWAQDLFFAHDLAEQSRRNPFQEPSRSFEDAAAFVREVDHRFGSFQNWECNTLKNKLLEMEFQGGGRVPLSRFYSGGQDDDWPFTESPAYLRSLGALDETDPLQPSVMIPNYISSQSNCHTPSSLYSVCCLDECEALLGRVEEEIAAPSASPARIAEVVSGLQSDTVSAPRNLSSALLARLGEIAELHDGRVPLHGRMFAQWMHHAYPRECSFPHVAGTVIRVSPFEWMEVMGLESPDASDEELRKHSAALQEGTGALRPEAGSPAMPWTAVEEQLAGYKQKAPAKAGPLKSLFRRGAAWAALLAIVVPLLRGSRRSLSSSESKVDRYMV